MILLDIDGCITAGKGNSIDLVALQILKQKINACNQTTALCTGRSAPYVEAIAQSLDINEWCICENGAYLYHTKTDEVIWNPNVNNGNRKHLQLIKQVLVSDNKFTKICHLEMGKEVCISLNPVDMSIEELYEFIKQNLDLSDLCIAHSTTAVDITPHGINKGSAIQLLCKYKNLNPKEILGVGDTMGDISFLNLCGQVACPHNAIDEIKKLSDYIATKEHTLGLVDIYNWITTTKSN